MDTFYVIINICDALEQPNFDFILAKNNYPKYCHDNKERAEKELLRLKSEYPLGDFVMLEAISYAFKRDDGIICVNDIDP